MKKAFNSFALLLFFAVSGLCITAISSSIPNQTNPENGTDPEAKDNKVEICHKGKTISVSANAVEAHLAHGDYLGSCSGASAAVTAGLEYEISDEPKVSTHSSNHQQMLADFSLFPNPAKNELNVSLPMIETEGELMIFAPNGKLIFSQKVNGDARNILINVSNQQFSSGIYFVKMLSDDVNLTKKLMIQK